MRSSGGSGEVDRRRVEACHGPRRGGIVRVVTLSIPPLEPEAPKRLVAPSQAEWDRMTPAERVAVVASLPVWVDIEEYGAMEGDEHRESRPGVPSR